MFSLALWLFSLLYLHCCPASSSLMPQLLDHWTTIIKSFTWMSLEPGFLVGVFWGYQLLAAQSNYQFTGNLFEWILFLALSDHITFGSITIKWSCWRGDSHLFKQVNWTFFKSLLFVIFVHDIPVLNCTFCFHLLKFLSIIVFFCQLGSRHWCMGSW